MNLLNLLLGIFYNRLKWRPVSRKERALVANFQQTTRVQLSLAALKLANVEIKN
ncbi:MAG: hypothetical protein Q8Q62_14870 [Mesorhizobium sp.]|nr:hypothetical protein [Mesorhizobium sp.]